MTDDKLDKIIEYWEEQLRENKAQLELFVGRSIIYWLPQMIEKEAERDVLERLSIIEDTLEQLKVLRDKRRDDAEADAWLRENPDAYAAVKRGLEDAKQGRVSKVDLS